MDKNEIVKAARRLPVESRRLIIEMLRKSIEWDETKDRAEVRLAELIPLACEALGVQEYDPRRKENADTYVRNLCAWAMRREGYSLPRIGHAMDRHPSSVIVMDRRGDEMRRGFFGADLQQKFNDFEKNVQYCAVSVEPDRPGFITKNQTIVMLRDQIRRLKKEYKELRTQLKQIQNGPQAENRIEGND